MSLALLLLLLTLAAHPLLCLAPGKFRAKHSFVVTFILHISALSAFFPKVLLAVAAAAAVQQSAAAIVEVLVVMAAASPACRWRRGDGFTEFCGTMWRSPI